MKVVGGRSAEGDFVDKRNRQTYTHTELQAVWWEPSQRVCSQ